MSLVQDIMMNDEGPLPHAVSANFDKAGKKQVAPFFYFRYILYLAILFAAAAPTPG